MITKTTIKRTGKKSFYNVEAPLTTVTISLYGSSPEEFDGKVITLDMSKNLRGKALEMRMRVHYHDGKLLAFPLSAKLAGTYIQRSLRRGADYLEDSFSVSCKEGKITVKPFMITRKRVSRNVRNALRQEAKKCLEEYIKIRSVKELFSDVLAGKIQKHLLGKLKKIYPLAFCEIRVFEINEQASIEK